MVDFYHKFIGKFCPVPILIVFLLMNLGVPETIAFTGTSFTNNADFIKEQKELVKEYKEKITMAELEIEKTNKDLDWLALKIQRGEESRRYIPQTMYDSLELKKAKIKNLTLLKNRFENLLKTKGMIEASDSQEEIEQKLAQAGLKEWMEFSETGKAFRLANRLPILFASGSADIPTEYIAFFKTLAAFVKEYDVRIIVEGYADIDPIHTGKYPSNFELGAARAANVVHLLEKYGVDSSVFKIGTTGKYRFNARKVSEKKILERHINITILFRS